MFMRPLYETCLCHWTIIIIRMFAFFRQECIDARSAQNLVSQAF